MTSPLPFDFAVDKQNNTIHVSKEFAADRSRVWDAFTKPEILDTWWAPKPWKARTASMDFREGGRWLYAMVSPEGEEHWSSCDYHSIRPRESFTGLDGFTDPQGNLISGMPRMTWKVTFTDKGPHTVVNVHITLESLEQLEKIIEMGFREGFTMTLHALEEMLA